MNGMGHGMSDSLNRFMPHGYCFLWQPDVLWLHVISDGIVAFSYFCIPFALIYFVRKRPDVPFRLVFWLFGAFILLCGTTHILSIWVLWHPTYYTEGVIKAMTAVASLGTLIMTIKMLPEAVDLPSPEQLRIANARLEEANAKLESLYADSQERGRATLGNVMDGVMTLDENRRIESVNAACTDIFGYTAEEMIGQDARMLVANAYRREHDSFFVNAKTLKDDEIGGGSVREAIGRHKDGREIPLQAAVSAFTIQGKRYFSSIIRDVTKTKQAEDSRQKLLTRLTESNTELERFAYVASHDMQEPLRMVLNFSQIITKDYGERLDDEGKEYLKIVGDSALRMRDMVQDLLEYARLGREGVSFATVDLNLELAHVEENLGALIKDAGAVITSDTLPMVNGNAVQLMRLLQNLIANAIKYQPVGRQPVIHVGVADEGDHWQIAVSDNGLGIEKAFIDQVFEPFRRLHTWDAIRGTGLGLSVCRKIVENHSGRIWATSELNQGSIFFFTLVKPSQAT
jgi:PAS domain S-box-containing protein